MRLPNKVYPTNKKETIAFIKQLDTFWRAFEKLPDKRKQFKEKLRLLTFVINILKEMEAAKISSSDISLIKKWLILHKVY